MTEQAGVICRRCGFANLPGDQFCGSCGAFLEWEGEAAGTPTAPLPPDEGIAGLVAPAGGVVPPPVVPPPPVATGSGWVAPPAPPPVAPPPVAPPPVAAGLLRCPACGIANGAVRTFCQSCGARLAEAPMVGAMSREQIAAAVAAKPTVAPVTPGVGPRPDPAAKNGSGSRGILGWVVGLAVLGLLVGGAIVVGGSLLKGQGPITASSSDPSAGLVTPVPSVLPGTAAPETTAPETAAPATPAPTPRIEGVQLAITGVAASSVLGGLDKFQPEQTLDGSGKTCWQEGSATEKGQWIEVSFKPARVDTLVLKNGYGASVALYKGNLRLKVIDISINGQDPIRVTLKDTAKAQEIPLGDVAGATRIRITIVSTYPSVKTAVVGTPFDDAALSEIVVIGLLGG
jgi:hypothetical protein